jgi:hypothetical protein
MSALETASKLPALAEILPNYSANSLDRTLGALLKTRSSSSLHTMHRRPSSFRGRNAADEEEAGAMMSPPMRNRKLSRDEEIDEFRRSDERRLSAVLMGPQMRSQRLIGNSNPRYRWERYWKTEQELKPMRKPMHVSQTHVYYIAFNY